MQRLSIAMAVAGMTVGLSVLSAPAGAAGGGVADVAVPKIARPASLKAPATVIGNGTPKSCTSAKVVKAVRKGGVVTFDCGPQPVVIKMAATAKVVNTRKKVVIDGGGKVTLDGRGKRRILYMHTCDKRQTWATSHCQLQSFPVLAVQNITLQNGYAPGASANDGGGAILARGGRFKAVNVTFKNNRCSTVGPDVGGAALRISSGVPSRPSYVVNSTFTGGRCSNGGGISLWNASLSVYNSRFVNNHATGQGLNPARKGTPGGGSGGAIYTDVNTQHLRVAGTLMRNNRGRASSGAVFFVSNNRKGRLTIRSSTMTDNPDPAHSRGLPGIFHLGRPAGPTIVSSVID
ncbi:MAG: right-handed parallel beta-helix repeat-containing protein [Aeromicrobium sp.]